MISVLILSITCKMDEDWFWGVGMSYSQTNCDKVLNTVYPMKLSALTLSLGK